MGDDPLAAAHAALAHHEWQRAFDEAASAVPPTELEAERGDLLAESAWWLGRLDDCIASRELAYRLYDERGADRQAGQCAVWLYEHQLIAVTPRSLRRGFAGRAARSRPILNVSNTAPCCCVRPRLRTATESSIMPRCSRRR